VAERDVDPVALRALAERLATEAAEFVRRRRVETFGEATLQPTRKAEVRAKSTPTDPVTVVDTETERLLRDRLAELRPKDHVLGEEEGGSTEAAPGRLTWVLDPIDGTVNFLYGIPAYAVSVGVQRDGVSLVGAVADVASGALYSAGLGRGALVRHGRVTTPLRCSAVTDLSMALVGTGFGYAPALRKQQAAVLAEMLPQVRDIRRIGAASLDLCAVASGRLDGYYEDNLQVWDWAAAALIAAEAGARVYLPRPVGPVGGAGQVVAAAPGIAKALTGALARSGRL
jgi:myo-inositol-1(or 4)-monophosphatase